MSESTPSIRVIGAPREPLRDFYHLYLRLPWAAALGLIIATYLLLNVAFALAYFTVGGVANARPSSFVDAFDFSIQTMGTIGYGAMYPTSGIANALVVLESVTGLLVTAVSTGLVFAKFSRSRGRIAFTRQAVISPLDGRPTLMIRLGNERSNQIMDVRIRIELFRTEHTLEGQLFYRAYDLALARSRLAALSRSWTVLHTIDAQSPLWGATPASMVRDEMELSVSVVGIDDTSLQPMYAQWRYLATDVAWGARYADVLSEAADGSLVLNLTRFNGLETTVPTDIFPYPPAPPS